MLAVYSWRRPTAPGHLYIIQTWNTGMRSILQLHLLAFPWVSVKRFLLVDLCCYGMGSLAAIRWWPSVINHSPSQRKPSAACFEGHFAFLNAQCGCACLTAKAMLVQWLNGLRLMISWRCFASSAPVPLRRLYRRTYWFSRGLLSTILFG